MDVLQVGGVPFLTATDDGVGLTPDDMHRMFSFGFSEKPESGISHRGFGFKSGSMRLGSDVFVVTRHRSTRLVGVGFLSRTFNERECKDAFKVPMVFWKPNGALLTPEHEAGQALSIMFRYGPFKSPAELFAELKKLNGQSGVRIVVCGLNKTNRDLELDFESNTSDILCSFGGRRISLRTYCDNRFPRMEGTAIFVRDKVIPTHSAYHYVDLSNEPAATVPSTDRQPTSSSSSSSSSLATIKTEPEPEAKTSAEHGAEVEPADRRNKKRKLVKVEVDGAADSTVSKRANN